ncbi:hypothetical protein [Roseomonas indoligenes]|uniref:Uncharacterized protein n=1 Tax=Roseomonas indoligenes TaxID=2820811 RepID=A0A940MYH1_9PROT|nr:hypothetical protein [Pararoseomonas indoligenes]MBP0493988.1 hypothetical protein [Pararoseomonas indoligenes]
MSTDASRTLSALAARWKAETNHDAGEAAAMAEHYAAPVGPDLPHPDPLTVGLVRGFHAHRASVLKEHEHAE